MRASEPNDTERSASARATRAVRTTESPLDLPTIGRAWAIAVRALRLRCPHCGVGAVLASWAAVRERCTGCGLRFKRSDDNYFSGAMFFGLIMGEAVFAVSLAITMLVSCPNVPWDALGYIGPIGMLLVMLLILPFSKV